MEADHALVREAHEKFYAALLAVCSGNPEPMNDCWVQDDSVTTAHPMGPWILGWGAIEATWREFAHAISNPTQRISGLEIRLSGDTAYTLCVEHWKLTMLGKAVEFSSNATNVYRKTSAGWRIVHHHADKAPSFEAAV